jgi:chemotaxis receptor (MCP) glutamine deamidase CheD
LAKYVPVGFGLPTDRTQNIVNANNYPQKMEEVRVDMAAMKVESKNDELLTYVGSSVAIYLNDSAHGSGGFAHIMLPHSAKVQTNLFHQNYQIRISNTLFFSVYKCKSCAYFL